MPMTAVRERTRVLEEEGEEALVVVVSEGLVVLMAVVEKIEPEMVRRVPAAGSCWQPASRARRTGAC